MGHFPKGDWKNLERLSICIILNIKVKPLSVIKHANNSADAICSI
jgi:hypothetical protein